MDQTLDLEKLTVKIAKELTISLKSVAAVVKLIEDGNTIPFIARYRKEATGDLDEVQIRAIQERTTYLKELEDRRNTIINSIESQSKMTPELLAKIQACDTKTELEDLYLPFKPKRRTRGLIAREKGLLPLALLIINQPLQGDPEKEAFVFVDPEKMVNNIDEALAGARDIVAEMVAENASVRKFVRQVFVEEGLLISKVADEKNLSPTKFEQYYNYKESVRTIPSHRYLAIRRGEKEDVLKFHIEIEPESVHFEIGQLYNLNPASPFKEQLEKAIAESCKRLIFPSVETDVRVDLKISADKSAVDVFADNLRNLLLAAPIGERAIIGIDPGLRTGCKCVAVDQTGKYLDTLTIYLCQGESQIQNANIQLSAFIKKYSPFAIGIGNGTGGRETEKMVKTLLSNEKTTDIIVLSVSESGASVYSASDIAREEFPDLDLTIRGAISIARRLQDPLAELVKVDPKAIGVGQYQHDVHQPLLHDKLTEVVESCVNHVGVELNTASASLLSHVAGINASLAKKIVKHREVNGAFTNRFELMDVSGLGAKAFEQAAGFLRVRGSVHPLDSSAVHPERYKLVESMAKDLNVSISELVANDDLIRQVDVKKYVFGDIGELTIKDIISELKKPGRDPRKSFEPPAFRDDILSVKDLKEGMKLEGIVTNVTAFGAFVDIGVHQDGLIHLSELADRFIKDANEVVKVGDKIQVKVLQIDMERNRISLTARTKDVIRGPVNTRPDQQKAQQKPALKKQSFSSNPFAGL